MNQTLNYILSLNETMVAGLYHKETPLDLHFGRRCIVEDHQDELNACEEHLGEMPKLCVHCKHRGQPFIVNGYIHFHCENPDESIAGKPGWDSLRDITYHDLKCWEK